MYFLLCSTKCPFLFCNHLDEEESSGCFTLIMLVLLCDTRLVFCISLSRCRGMPGHTRSLFEVVSRTSNRYEFVHVLPIVGNQIEISVVYTHVRHTHTSPLEK